MLQAIYYSTASCHFSETQLLALLETARINNFRFAITGMLVFERGVFMQVIEGPKENVEHLLSALQADPRHHKIQILSVKPIHAREFGEWDMAFFRECAPKSDPDGFLDLASIKEEFTIDSSMATQMLSLFQAGLFRDAADDPEESVGSCTITIRSRRPDHDPKRQRYLVELGRAMALSLPGVPVSVGGDGTEITFNQLRDLDYGEIEMF
jgi:hypothetical protein